MWKLKFSIEEERGEWEELTQDFKPSSRFFTASATRGGKMYVHGGKEGLVKKEIV